MSPSKKPGAKQLQTSGTFDNLLAFVNPDRSVVVVVQTEGEAGKELRIKAGNKSIRPLLKGNSFNSF